MSQAAVTGPVATWLPDGRQEAHRLTIVQGCYHTGRFVLVPGLKSELAVKTPADRNPGRAWTAGAPVTQAPDVIPGAAIRLGCARCSTVGQELQSQLDMLACADCTRVFSEKISTRVKERPELGKALTLAREIKAAAPNQPVILTVAEISGLPAARQS